MIPANAPLSQEEREKTAFTADAWNEYWEKRFEEARERSLPGSLGGAEKDGKRFAPPPPPELLWQDRVRVEQGWSDELASHAEQFHAKCEGMAKSRGWADRAYIFYSVSEKPTTMRAEARLLSSQEYSLPDFVRAAMRRESAKRCREVAPSGTPVETQDETTGEKMLLQEPDYVHLEISYRGTPPQIPRSFTVHEQWKPFRSRDVLVFVGTPSADGRVFGTDCVRLEMEREDWFNPTIYTDFEGLEGRESTLRLDQRSRCANPEASYKPHLRVTPGIPAKLTYQVHPRQSAPEPEVGQPVPEPAGPTDVFLADGKALDRMGERVTPAEWDVLKQQAVKPGDVRVAHDAKAKSISVTVDGPLTSDLALVAGTKSSDGRFFGFDCVRLDTGPEAAGR